MKSVLQLAFLALVMFSVSAGLSIWLYQQKPPAETADAAKEKDAPAKKKEPDHPPEREPVKPDVKAPPPPPKTGDESSGREARLEKRLEQVDLILRDLQSQRESYDSLVRQLAAELKQSGNKVLDLDTKAAEIEKKRLDLDVNERKNLERMATLYDSMTPETAAPILKQMADTGRLDTAVKILALMKERQAARLLDALGDPMLAAQLLDRMRGLKPAAGVTPAAGKQP